MTKIPKDCGGAVPIGAPDGSTNNASNHKWINKPHKPEGSTNTQAVVGGVIGGVVVILIVVVILLVYGKLRKRTGGGAIYNYKRVDADHVDDGEDVHMLLTS